MAATLDALEIGFAGQDEAGSVTGSLVLPSESAGGIEIEWFSNRPDLVSSEGAMVRPSFASGDVEVVLTAIVIASGKSGKKTFSLRLKALPQTDAEAVLADASVLEVQLAQGDTPEALSSSLGLPASGSNGSTISWSANRPELLSAEGKLLRPLGSDERVRLTATLTKGEASKTKVFFFSVKARQEDEPADAIEAPAER